MVKSVSLSSEMQDLLFDMACDMLKGGKGRMIIREEDIEGEIRTSFETRCFGSVSGVEFKASVETDLGKGNVKFLVRAADVEKKGELEWVHAHSMEDLIEEVTAPPGRNNATFN